MSSRDLKITSIEIPILISFSKFEDFFRGIRNYLQNCLLLLTESMTQESRNLCKPIPTSPLELYVFFLKKIDFKWR